MLISSFANLLNLKKNGQAPFIAPLNLLPLLRSHPGGVQKELVVKDLPATKVAIFVSFYKQSSIQLKGRLIVHYASDLQHI